MRYLGVLLLVTCGSVCRAAEWPDAVWKQNKDLNGDGQVDHTSLTVLGKDTGKYCLSVNNVQIADAGDHSIRGLIIVDLDRSDRYKEVAVRSYSGEGDRTIFAFYWYNGRTIHRVGTIAFCSLPKGDGRVTEGLDCGFWQRRQPFVLDRKHQLVPVNLPLYEVDRAGAALKRFVLYRSRDHHSAVATVQPGLWVRVLYCDCRGEHSEGPESSWNYLVRTEKGQRGWTHIPFGLIDLGYAQ